MTRAVTFRQAEATRLIKAALAAGLAPGTFSILATREGVRLLTGETPRPLDAGREEGGETNEWDEVLPAAQ